MLTFRRVTYRNFLSCGNTPITIDLNKHQNTLIIGKNGTGKSSSVTDTLTFALFGKPFRNINKPTIVNSENEKDCLVEVEFDLNGKTYIVRRGIKPNIFDIIKDGELITKDASVTDYQDYLEKNILKMNYKSFTQIVILGSASFTPFMQLKAGDRREIIEDLLDIQIFSSMNILAKQKLQILKENTEKNDTEKRLTKAALDGINDTIAGMERNVVQNIDELKAEHEENLGKIEELNEKIEEILARSEEMKEHEATVAGYKKKVKGLISIRAKMEATIGTAKKELSFFENNDQCPSCSQDIDALFKTKKIETNVTKTKVGQESITEINESMADLEAKIDSVEKIIQVMSRDIHKVTSYRNEIGLLQKSNKNLMLRIEEMTNSEKLLAATILKRSELETTLNDLDEARKQILLDREYYDQLVQLLKDGGIKTKIIKRYIPIINTIINKYLTAMNLYVSFNLNENFDEVIKSRFKSEFSYANFSEGEKFRIDIAILLAWRQLAKMRNSVNCNLLIMDEIFDSSLDVDGTEDFLKIMLNELSDINLFVISHKSDALRDKFTNTLRFEKVKGFTRIGDD